jgi:hypothetical protein
VEAARLRDGGLGGVRCGGRGEAEELLLSSFVVVFSPVLPTRFIPGRMRQPSDDARTRAKSVDHAGLEVEEHCAW